jgi:hypothetical protein
MVGFIDPVGTGFKSAMTDLNGSRKIINNTLNFHSFQNFLSIDFM